jgi:hypothetical protein
MATKNRTLGKALTTSFANIYVVPARHKSLIKSVLISNTTAALAKVSLDWYDSATTTYYTICKDVAMFGNGIIQLEDSLWLQPDDLIRGLANVAGVTISIYVEEQYAVAL